MEMLRLQEILLCLLLCLMSDVGGLKCRTATDSQQNNDFEYVVRMCLRHLRNESDIFDLYRAQNDFNMNKRYRNDMQMDNNNNNNNNNNNDDGDDNKNYYSRNKNYFEGFDRFWPSNSGSRDRNRYGDDERYRQEGDYAEFDFSGDSRSGRKKYRGRPQIPHSYQQQLQHDRDMYNRGNRDPQGYFYSNRNKNTKTAYNKDRNNDSPLAEIDPCVIHCIFQEMQMVDDNGKPNKGLISQKMTQKIWNSELKKFLQESIDECFDAIDDSSFDNNRNSNSNNRHRKQEQMCDWAKTFAICLEDRGRENCDDWNEPFQKNHSNSRNSEDQRHKSKQNDRG